MESICIIDYDMSVVGGVEQVTAALASELADYYDVHLISLCMMNSERPVYNIDKRVRFVNLLGKESRLLDMKKKAAPLLKNYYKENKIKAAIFQGNYTGFICSLTGGKIKTIFCDHGALMNQWSQKDIVAIRLIAALGSKKTVALTHQSMDDYIRKFRLSKKRVTYIYNWIDEGEEHSSSYNLDSKRIISAGRFGKEKGFDTLVKAYKKVYEKHPDWSLDIYGDGEMMDEVKQIVSDEKLEEVVFLKGMVKSLSSIYKDYAMYVLPSHREGMPLVLLEAKLNKLPIVSFDIMTGPREIIRDGIDGILVPPEDTDKFADAICKLIEDDSLRKNMSDKTYDNLQEFSKEEILKKWIEIIEE